MKEKMAYNEPELEVVYFDPEDIITMSGELCSPDTTEDDESEAQCLSDDF